MPTVNECLDRAKDFERLALRADSETKRRSYLASAEQCRRLAARPHRNPHNERRHMSSAMEKRQGATI